jgi:hypothetical protein
MAVASAFRHLGSNDTAGYTRIVLSVGSFAVKLAAVQIEEGKTAGKLPLFLLSVI